MDAFLENKWRNNDQIRICVSLGEVLLYIRYRVDIINRIKTKRKEKISILKKEDRYVVIDHRKIFFYIDRLSSEIEVYTRQTNIINIS
jgi:hypothetical protein